ncbi:MAG: hypothetical protein V4754_22360 [Pseudomonadota bacterium]
MPDRSRPSTSLILAATLAAVLTAGAGAAYWYRQSTPPAGAAQRAAGTTSARQTAPPQVPQGGRSKQQAAAFLMELPEIKAWSNWLETKSGGRVHGALFEDSDTPSLVDGKSYWRFSFFENDAQAAHRWESFYVPANGAGIMVEDSASGQLLDLTRWRSERLPLKRIATP